MLRDGEAIATIGVRNTDRAKEFYEGVLGLRHEGPEREGVLTYRSGSSKLFVYQSEFAGTNKATAATWVGNDVEREVEALKRRA